MLADFTVPVRLVVVNFCLRSERIIKIGQYLPSLCSTEKGPVFWLTVYMYIGKWHIIWSVTLNWTNSLNLNLICQLWSTFDNNETNRCVIALFVLRWKSVSMCEYVSRDEWWGCSLLCRATPGEMVTDNKVTVDGLTGGTSYEFRVAAVNEIGRGDYSQTKEACRPPSAFSYIPLSIFVKRSIHASFVKMSRLRNRFSLRGWRIHL